MLTSLFQLGIIGLAYRRIKRTKVSWRLSTHDSLTVLLWTIGGAYALVLVLLQYFLALDTLDYRLLSPVSLLFYVGGHLYLTKRNILY